MTAALTPAGLVLTAQPVDPDPGMVAAALQAALLTIVAQVLDPDRAAVIVALVAGGIALVTVGVDSEITPRVHPRRDVAGRVRGGHGRCRVHRCHRSWRVRGGHLIRRLPEN